MKSLLGRVTNGFSSRREAWPWLDHLVRAGARYKGDGGDRLAAALTMYAIFALLPLMLLGMSILGYVMADDPERQYEIFTTIASALPGVGTQIAETLSSVENNRGTLGLVGLVGLVFSGLGGITALRDALRLMWHQSIDAGNFFRKKLSDAITLLVLGVTLVVSFAVTAMSAGGAGALLSAAGIDGGLARVILYVLAFVVGVVVDAALFLVLYKWLPRVDWPWQRLVRGAIFGGVAFGGLKILGAWYVGRTATRSTALYGSIGTAVALLVGLYLISRVILFTAAWTVTAPGWDDVEPSGTASPEAAIEAGIPVEEARGGASYNGGTTPPDTNTPGRRPGDRKPDARAPRPGAPQPVAAQPFLPSGRARERTVLAARAVTGFGAALIAAAGVSGLKSLRRS